MSSHHLHTLFQHHQLITSAGAATTTASSNNNNNNNKRKLDDYTDVDYSYSAATTAHNYQHHHQHFSAGSPSPPTKMKRDHHTHPVSPSYPSSSSPLCVQFFVRMISEGKTLVLHADPNSTIKSIHKKIYTITGIPVIEQRLLYLGKQLQWEQTLSECDVQNDAGLHLVGRMRSTEHPKAWQLMNDMVTHIFDVYRNQIPCFVEIQNHFYDDGLDKTSPIKKMLAEFLRKTPTTGVDQAAGHLQIFLASSAPAALVMLYMSPLERNKKCGKDAIEHFILLTKTVLSKPMYGECAPIILEFCNLLNRAAGCNDPLYIMCRSSLASMVEHIRLDVNKGNGTGGVSSGNSSSSGKIEKVVVTVRDIFVFVSELAIKLLQDLESSTFAGPPVAHVRDFTAFLAPVRNAIVEKVGYNCQITVPLPHLGGGLGYRYSSAPCMEEEIKLLYDIYVDLLGKMELCLKKMEENLAMLEKVEVDSGWSQYLVILKELNSIAKLYKGVEAEFWLRMRQSKVALCYLIVRFSKRTDDNWWLLEQKEVTNFQARRHLAMMLLPDVRDEYDELHEMLIDRSQLLSESFEYIAHADPESLRSGLFMEFKNEEATGPGVLREWFFLVCQAIFNPQNALFVACPNDRRRFFPNPASKVDPLHLEYFNFSGRVIALALMHKVQVGVVFDRAFFLQLAGQNVSLEDIRDADPYLYNSCKQILDMDPGLVDEDALGLTFIREVEELGSRKIVELCPDGKNTTVTSKNRKQYVDLLIKHRFVTSIAEQVTHFAQGFADIIGSQRLQRSFLKGLDPVDLDLMLHGNESPISVEDWKAYTEYNGYKETDPQILWFWKIVGQMTAEQRKVLLFFWTSVKYLPPEGFGGLASRLYIYKNSEASTRLPSSHTCFYRLCFPPYPSMPVMQERFQIITQEHVGCSFGTW